MKDRAGSDSGRAVGGIQSPIVILAFRLPARMTASGHSAAQRECPKYLLDSLLQTEGGIWHGFCEFPEWVEGDLEMTEGRQNYESQEENEWKRLHERAQDMYKVWNNFKTTLLMSLLMGLCLAVGYLLGGQAALIPALVIGAAINFFAFFFSDKIALATMRAREISRSQDPALWAIVANLAERAGLPMPRICVSPAQAPNAFATGRGPRHSAVCVTEGLRQMLSHEELEGVIAHELAHIKHRDILIGTIAAVVAGAVTWVTYLVFWGGGSRRSNPLVALLLLILAPVAAALIQMAISRSREFEADRLGAELAGTGRGLARALQKLEAAAKRIRLRVPDAQSNMFIVAPLTGSEMAGLFRTHPPTEERIARLMS